jgi:hypothetical protein
VIVVTPAREEAAGRRRAAVAVFHPEEVAQLPGLRGSGPGRPSEKGPGARIAAGEAALDPVLRDVETLLLTGVATPRP